VRFGTALDRLLMVSVQAVATAGQADRFAGWREEQRRPAQCWRSPRDKRLPGTGFLGFFKVTGGPIFVSVCGLGGALRRRGALMLVLRHRLAIAGVITAVARSQLTVLAASAGISVSRTAIHQGDGDVCQR
jgi:hypothetical protein